MKSDLEFSLYFCYRKKKKKEEEEEEEESIYFLANGNKYNLNK